MVVGERVHTGRQAPSGEPAQHASRGRCAPSPCFVDTVGFGLGLRGLGAFRRFLLWFVLFLTACFRCSFLKYTWDLSEHK